MKDFLSKLEDGQHLSEAETRSVFSLLMNPDSGISDEQIASYLRLTSARTPSVDELVGAASSLREHMVQVDVSSALGGASLLDTCGTGGSGLNTFNTSTAVGILVAACGQAVAKHGTYAVTSRSGSADVLRALGLRIELTADEIIRCAVETNYCFLFAPAHHPATKRVGGIRKQLGIRTIFNLIGPLSNPAGANYQLLGVSDSRTQPLLAQALQRLGVTRGFVVFGDDGLDEITLTTTSTVCDVRPESIETFSICPEKNGITPVEFAQIEGFEPEQAARKMEEIFSGEQSAYADLVRLNAGTALYLCGKAADIPSGIELADSALKDKKALELLARLREIVGGGLVTLAANVKICGITSLDDAQLAIELGAKALGFNFHRPSPRYISPLDAQTIVRQLSADVWTVGVFVDCLQAEVEQIARQVGLDTLQFHGEESADYCQHWSSERCSWRVIKAVALKDSDSVQTLAAFGKSADYFLLDAWSADLAGGTGLEASDALLEEAFSHVDRQKVFLAGGLNPDNVAEKVAKYQPFAVDVASGVEASPGKKSVELLQAFFASLS